MNILHRIFPPALAHAFLIFVFILGVFINYRFSQSRSYSIHFVDEEDHIIFAHYMNQGYKLYTELSSNHQALPYLFSSAIQKISKPLHMPMLIKRHRQAIFLYSALWGLVLLYFFRWKGLFAWMLMESLKYSLLGNLLLAESLALYPAVFLFSSVASVFFEKKGFGPLRLIVMGLACFIVLFNLVPLWPFLLLIACILLITHRKNILPFVLTVTFLTIILFMLISPFDWFKETVQNNVMYAMPQLNTLHTPLEKLSVLVFPFLIVGKGLFSQTISIGLSLIALISTFALAVFKRDKKGFLLFLVMYILSVTANTRVPDPSSTFFHGFHILPWLGIWVYLGIYCIFYLLKETPKYRFIFFPLLITGIVFLLLHPSLPYRWKTEPSTEYYVNYANFEDYARLFRILHKYGDRLAVFTNESLIHWNTGMKPATRQIVYYAWEQSVPDLKSDFQHMLTQTPPEFIYGSNEWNLVSQSYFNILKNNNPTLAYVRKDRFALITDEQKKELQNWGFSFSDTLSGAI